MNGLITPARHFNPENLVKTPFHVVVRSRNYLPYNIRSLIFYYYANGRTKYLRR